MNIDTVLKMDSGSVVCVENGATITVKKDGENKTFTSTWPKKSPPMSEQIFEELYKHKHFEKPAEKPATKAGNK